MNAKWNPEDYRGHSDAQRKFAEDLLVRLGKIDREAILDLGCGDGRVTAFLAESHPDCEVVGVDSSREMIEYASKNFPSRLHPNLRAYQLIVEIFKLASHIISTLRMELIYGASTIEDMGSNR